MASKKVIQGVETAFVMMMDHRHSCVDKVSHTQPFPLANSCFFEHLSVNLK